jgi:hypothetical protein
MIVLISLNIMHPGFRCRSNGDWGKVLSNQPNDDGDSVRSQTETD